MRISVVSLLPMILYITEQQVGSTVLSQIPVVTLPLLGVATVGVYGYYSGDGEAAVSLVLVSLLLLAVPVTLTVLIQGGGLTAVLPRLVDTLIAGGV